MKLTIPSSDVLPNGSRHFFSVFSISHAGFCSSGMYTSDHTETTVKILATHQKLVFGINKNHEYNSTVSQKDISMFRGLNHKNTDHVTEFADASQSASQNAGRRIFFRTRLSKTSVELLSLTTGLCSVRVKNKATGEATLLLVSRCN